MIDHEYLRRWAVVISIAGAVTAVGMKYAVMNHQMEEMERERDRLRDRIKELREYVDDVKKTVSSLEGRGQVRDYQIKQIMDKLNRAAYNEEFEDE